MKKALFSLSGLLFGVILVAQPTITFEKHALIPGEINQMVLVEFLEPGNAGANQVWDFSELKVKTDFEGAINQTSKSIFQNDFEHSNSILEEFGNRFFFNVQNDQIESYGMVSASGKSVVKYTRPYIKMKYPFQFGNQFSGNFEGNYGTDQKELGKIIGNYEVTADGNGRLIVPGNEYSNALRIKSYREETRKNENRSYKIIYETYRWYVSNHRFPVLVLTKASVVNNGKTSVSHQAALNANVINLASTEISSDMGLALYPNPVVDELSINYTVEVDSKVKIELYDLSGKLVDILLEENKSAGNYMLNYTIGNNIKSGNYIVNTHIGNLHKTNKIVISK